MNAFAIQHARTLSILVLFIAQFSIILPGFHAVEGQMTIEPAAVVEVGQVEPIGTTEYRVAVELDKTDGGRRRLAPFQLCLVCKCCVSAADPTSCATMPCCFGIDCQLPNKPFGVCAFVPKTCNCMSCAT